MALVQDGPVHMPKHAHIPVRVLHMPLHRRLSGNGDLSSASPVSKARTTPINAHSSAERLV